MLKAISKENVRAGFEWIIVKLFGNLFPVWGGFFYLWLLRKNPNIYSFSSHGQFAIYAATFVASSFYIVFKDYRSSRIWGKKIFGFLCIILVVGITYVFTITSVSTENLYSTDAASLHLCRTVSFLLFGISFLLAFYLSMADKRRESLDIVQDTENKIRTLADQVNNIGE